MLDTAEHDTAVQARPHAETQAGRPIEHPTERPPVQEPPAPFEVPSVPQMDSDAWLTDLDADPDMGRPLPPQAPPPVPKKRWFGRPAKAAKSVPMPAADEPPGQAKSSMSLKPVLFVSLCGIAVLAYMQYGPGQDKPQDLLGTALPSVESTGPTDPDLIMPAIDPRLGGPDALSLGVAPQPVLAPEEAFGPAVEPVDTLGQTSTPVVKAEPMEPMTASPAAAAPAVLAAAQPVAQASVDPALDERMRRMEDLMVQMSQQLAQMKAQQVAASATAPAPAPAARPAAQPAPMPQAAPAATAPQRILVQAEPAKASPPVRAAQPQPQRVARAQPVAKPKAAEAEAPAKPQAASPRLISVDMWNGEPSVVVASGIPGDKRMRVLRPGDVVNGMALRSVDPVTRSVTFAGPESRSITLSMATGG